MNVFLHGKKRLGNIDRKGRCCDNILVHLKEFGPILSVKKTSQVLYGIQQSLKI